MLGLEAWCFDYTTVLAGKFGPPAGTLTGSLRRGFDSYQMIVAQRSYTRTALFSTGRASLDAHAILLSIAAFCYVQSAGT
jgi:hypothetical protein